MKNICLYSFNKITRGLVRFRDLLDFRIDSIIDFALNIDSDAGELVDGNISGIRITDSIESGLRNVDTLLLLDTGDFFPGNKTFYDKYNLGQKWRELVQNAYKNGIQVISVQHISNKETLGWLQEHDISIHIHTNINDSLLSRMDERYHLTTATSDIGKYLQYFENDRKMHNIDFSITKIGIFATRGCLGKFTTQMSLLREMNSHGAKVSALITEPTGSLFKQPEADIFKFLSKRPLDQYFYYINSLVQDAEESDNQYIIMAAQDSITPSIFTTFSLQKIGILHSFMPDVTLLIVGYEDDQNIREAIEILRIFGNGHPPLALLLPDKVETQYGEYKYKSQSEIIKRKDWLKSTFNIQNVESILDIHYIAEIIMGHDLSNKRYPD